MLSGARLKRRTGLVYDILLADVERKAYIQLKSGGSRLLFHYKLFLLFALHHYVQRRISMHQDCRAGGGDLTRKGIHKFRGIELHELKFILYIIQVSINCAYHRYDTFTSTNAGFTHRQ